MEFEKEYFYITRNFAPNHAANFDHVENDIYRHKVTGELYRKRLLYDFGWGQESGFVKYPEPSFEVLIALVEYVPFRMKKTPFYLFSKKMRKLNLLCHDNGCGAISVIMEDHVDELIEFLTEKMETDYFEDAYVRKNFYRFRFDREKSKEFGISVGGTVKTKSYCEILQAHDGWASISARVIEKVYR